jgi:hypothetical protein
MDETQTIAAQALRELLDNPERDDWDDLLAANRALIKAIETGEPMTRNKGSPPMAASDERFALAQRRCHAIPVIAGEIGAFGKLLLESTVNATFPPGLVSARSKSTCPSMTDEASVCEIHKDENDDVFLLVGGRKIAKRGLLGTTQVEPKER